tara:strand:+ start:376 stop:555 length:180 start_codon:yes stop_codon:yes gene_type:complete
MKVFKYKSHGRESVVVLDKVVRVSMSEAYGWVNLLGYEDDMEVSRDIAEGLIKAMEEDV